MRAFTYLGQHYIRVIPGKRLFQSNLIHEVVNRGDIFAVRLSDSTLTIIPGNAKVEHWTLEVPADPPPEQLSLL